MGAAAFATLAFAAGAAFFPTTACSKEVTIVRDKWRRERTFLALLAEDAFLAAGFGFPASCFFTGAAFFVVAALLAGFFAAGFFAGAALDLAGALEVDGLGLEAVLDAGLAFCSST